MSVSWMVTTLCNFDTLRVLFTQQQSFIFDIFIFVFNLCSFLLYISHLYSIFSFFYCLIAYLHSIVFTFVFNLCSLLFYKRLFIFDVLHLYSIVKAQQNLPNDMCALPGLMRVFAAEWAYRGRKGWGFGGYDNMWSVWSVYGGVDGVDGLGWGVRVGLVGRG